jgi:soluble lytic murein transglycosylase-like protein
MNITGADIIARSRQITKQNKQNDMIIANFFIGLSLIGSFCLFDQEQNLQFAEPSNLTSYYISQINELEIDLIDSRKQLVQLESELNLQKKNLANKKTCKISLNTNKKTVKLRSKWAGLIQKFSSKHGLDPAFVESLIWQESRFNEKAISSVGAAGLMQLMPATAERFGCYNRLDPSENIKAGTAYLAWLSKRFKGDKKLILAAYNAGEGAVAKYKGIPPYKETIAYVPKVLNKYKSYEII